MTSELAVTIPSKGCLKAGAVAGLIGGLAEVIYMSAYCLISGKSGLTILSYITLTFLGRDMAFGPLGEATGMLIHLAASVSIGMLFGVFMTSVCDNRATSAWAAFSGAVTLVGIWAFNFFILGPAVSPEFVEAVPAGVALFSKLLFGLSLGVYVKFVPVPDENTLLGVTT